MKAYLVVSSFVVAAVTLFFLVAVLLKGISSRRNRTFCLFGVSVFVWIFGHMFWQLAGREAEAIFWIRVLIVGSSLIPFTYLHFVSEMIGERRPWLIRGGYIFGGILAALAFTDLIFTGVDARLGFDYWPVAGPLFGLYLGAFGAVVIYCFYVLISQYRASPAKIRNQNKYLIIGTAIGFFGGSTNFPLWTGIPIPPIGHGLSIFYILGIGYSVLKYRLLDFNEMAVRLLGLICTAVLIGSGMTVVLLGILEVFYPGFYPSGFSFWWTLFSLQSLVFLVASPALFRFINRIIQARLISGRFAYREDLRELSEQVLSDGGEDEMLDTVARRMQEIMALDFAAIFMRSDFESRFNCIVSVGSRPKIDYVNAAEIEPIIRIFQRSRKTVFLDEQMERSSSFRKEIEAFLGKENGIRSSDVFFPIHSQGSIYGFLILGSSGHSGDFSDVDLLLLENLCSQIGVTFRSREIERISNQVEKLVSLGTMAAGLSHELRNPLVSIRTLANLLERKPEAFDINEDFRTTVQRDVRRISGIVEGVSTFAQDGRRSLAPVHMAAVIEEVKFGMKERLESSRIKLEVKQDDSLPPVFGNFEQLIQVFQNIIENAINAISEWPERPEQGRILVSMQHQGGDGIEERNWVNVLVSDNGPGIPNEVANKIFDPFVTSRDTGVRLGSTGTGLGLAIVNKIVQLHNGVVAVRTEKWGGACFEISLPCAA